MSPQTAQAPTGLPFAWKGDALVITDADALARIDRKALSASTMKSMQGCPARYAAEKLMPSEEDPFSPAAVGTAAHTVFETLFALKPHKRTEDKAMEILLELTDETWTSEEKVQALNWSSAVREKVLPLFKMTDPREIEVVSIEERFDGIELAGIPFVGFIDLVDKEPRGIRINDWKTGRATTAAAAKRFGDSEGDQLRLYAAAYRARYGVTPKAARLGYTGAGRFRSVSVTGPAIERTLALFSQAWVDLKSYVAKSAFPTKVSALCGWCPLVNACPVAQAEGKTAQVPAPSAKDLDIRDLLATPKEKKVRTLNMLDDLAAALEAGQVLGTPCSGADPQDTPIDEWSQDETAAALREDEESAHQDEDKESESGKSAGDEESTMIDGFTRNEAKPWEGGVTSDKLDPNTYEATALFGTVSLAVEQLGNAGVKITPSTVRGLSATFAEVILGAQEEMVGRRDWGSGANTRIRGALHAVLATVPLPFGGDEEDWDAWVARATRRCVSIARAVIDLHEENYDERPWAALAVHAVPDAA